MTAPAPSDLLTRFNKLPKVPRERVERAVWAILSFTSPTKSPRRDVASLVMKMESNKEIMLYAYEVLARTGSMGSFAKVIEPLIDMWIGKWRLSPEKYEGVTRAIALGLKPHVEKLNPTAKDYSIAYSLAVLTQTLVEKLKDQKVDEDKGLNEALQTASRLVRSLQFLKSSTAG